MKKINSSTWIVIVAALMLATLTVACGGKSPKKVAEEAVKAELSGDLEKLYHSLTEEDQKAVTWDNFMQFYKIPADIQDALELIPEVKEAIKVEKFTSSVTGETATVSYFIILPDLEKIGNLSLEDAKRILSTGGKRLKDLPEDIQQKIKESVKKDGVPTQSYAKELKLKREGDWRIYMNLARQIADTRRISTVYDHD